MWYTLKDFHPQLKLENINKKLKTCILNHWITIIGSWQIYGRGHWTHNEFKNPNDSLEVKFTLSKIFAMYKVNSKTSYHQPTSAKQLANWEHQQLDQINSKEDNNKKFKQLT